MTAPDPTLYPLHQFLAWLAAHYERPFALERGDGTDGVLTGGDVRVSAVTADLTEQEDAPPSWRDC